MAGNSTCTISRRLVRALRYCLQRSREREGEREKPWLFNYRTLKRWMDGWMMVEKAHTSTRTTISTKLHPRLGGPLPYLPIYRHATRQTESITNPSSRIFLRFEFYSRDSTRAFPCIPNHLPPQRWKSSNTERIPRFFHSMNNSIEDGT